MIRITIIIIIITITITIAVAIAITTIGAIVVVALRRQGGIKQKADYLLVN